MAAVVSVIETSRGKFKVRYRVGTKQYSKSGFTSKREARAYEAEQLRKIRSGSWTDPQAAKVPLRTIFNEWIVSKRISERTRSDYRELWDNVVEPTWGHVRLEHITPTTITQWVTELSETVSAARTRKAFTIFSQLLDWAVADERIPVSPVPRAKALARGALLPTGRPSSAKRFLSHAEVLKLADQAGDYRLMLLVMAYTGVRFGEATALQARDVDLLRGRLLVQRAYTDIRGRLELSTPKSGKSREVPLPPPLREPLAQLLGTLSDPEALLFTAERGGPVRYSRFRKNVFDPAVEASGLSGLTPHGLRHTYAALAVQAGANPKVLQEAMGHSDIRLTLDTYGGLFGDDLDSLADKLGAAAGQIGGGPVRDVPSVFPIASGMSEGI